MIRNLAWRNIWRNKRRTLITAASIFFAIFLSLLMRSVQDGTFTNIVNSVVRSYSGYIQVHLKGYWNEKEINNSFLPGQGLIDSLQKINNVAAVIPRLESFALASSGPETKGLTVIGVDPAGEEKVTRLKENVIAGRYLNASDTGVLIARKAAEYLGLHVGDTLVLIGQGFHGTSAAGKWPVLGILHFKSPVLDRQMVFMPIRLCQSFYTADSYVTSLVIDLKDPEMLNRTMKAINRTSIVKNYEVMSWDMMMPDLVQFIQSKMASSLIMIGILYMIVGFGIFGTTLMMTLERIRELGMMMSLGTRKIRLSLMVLLETVFIGATGVISGVMAAMPVILYFAQHPIRLAGEMAKTYETYGYEALICFQPPGNYVLNNALVIFILVLIAAIYPMRKIARLDLVSALHHKV